MTGIKNKIEYRTWLNMKQRCYNKNLNDYKHYGGRGIKVCDRWLISFEDFLRDMGKRPSDKRSIDRINNEGNYEPGNCRWATYAEQSHNRRQPFIVKKVFTPINYSGIYNTTYDIAHKAVKHLVLKRNRMISFAQFIDEAVMLKIQTENMKIANSQILNEN